FYKNAALVSQGASIAVRKGIIVINSAGNEGANNWKYLIFPADADSVCAVGAVNGSGVIAGFSSIGYQGKIKPNIVSVGAGTIIAGTNNQPSSGSGTSFANPNVAGLIACLWQAFPTVNNMRILDAVYQSSNRYSNPDSRYGFGIPNFRTAYQLLKHDQNNGLYGNDWFFATPNPFTSVIDIKFIGRIDGTATISIVNEAKQIVASQAFNTEKEEVYNYAFTGLTNLPRGNYIVRYTDNTTTKDLLLQHENMFVKDWIIVAPNPFKDNILVYLKAPQAGEINLRLLDVKGRLLEIYTATVSEGQTTTIRLKSGSKLPKGIYFLQYQDKNQKKIFRMMKG
ncbi:MAG TPA: S8 family serine peptidase, partial [Segetibacter sp.]